MMRTLVFAVCMAAGMAASPLSAAEKWAQASVVLKRPNATILPDKGVGAPSIFQIGWPATVQKTDGTWALLGGTPGFQKKSKVGWVRIFDLVNGNDNPLSGSVSHYYTSKIEESPNPETRATWYWLRGIYWDNNNDTRAAIHDYALAILDLSDPFFVHDENCKECKDYEVCRSLCRLVRQDFGSEAMAPGESPLVLSGADRRALLSDCYRRLGTALANVDPVCTYCCWKKCFKEAEGYLDWDSSGHAAVAPRLYYEWGNAYVNALGALYGGPPSVACKVPGELSDTPSNDSPATTNPPTNSSAAVKAAVDEACKLLHKATKLDSQFADAHAALGDLETTYASYLVSVASAAAKPSATPDDKAKASQLKDSPEDELQSAIDDYRDAIQCDSTSNRGYLGQSGALQQLAYIIAGKATKPPLSTATCPCCVASSNPSAKPQSDCQKINAAAAAVCQLAQAANAKTPPDITETVAKVKSLLSAAAVSAQAALATGKGLSDNLSIMQYATTQRDLAYLNDAKPSVAYWYALSAYVYAADAVPFAKKIEDGNSLSSFASCMQQLADCYEKGCKLGTEKHALPASAPAAGPSTGTRPFGEFNLWRTYNPGRK
jgi:hypothetical protein